MYIFFKVFLEKYTYMKYMFRYRRMAITCYILYGKSKKQKAIVIFHG